MSATEPLGEGALPLDALDATASEIDARFEWARANGHPGYVWPRVPIGRWLACGREIERITRSRLLDDGTVPRLEIPPGATAEAVGVAAFSAGMGPLLGHWLEIGALRAPADVSELLALHLAHGRRRAERQRAALRTALDAIGGAGVTATVVKGAHTGAAYFPEPGTRPAADVDLVVPRRALGAAEAALARAGFTRGTRQARPYKCDWVPPDAPLTLPSLDVAHGDAPFAVEVHDSLERVFFGVRRISFVAVSGSVVAPALHAHASVLAQPLLVAFLATHASEELHQLQLLRLVELALVIRSDAARGALAWSELHALLALNDALRFTYPAFALTERLAPGTVDAEFLARVTASATPRMRRLVAGLTPAGALRPDRVSLEERFLWADGPVETLRRAAYLLWPAHAARSLRPLRSVYAERLYRIMRRRVSVRAGGDDGVWPE